VEGKERLRREREGRKEGKVFPLFGSEKTNKERK